MDIISPVKKIIVSTGENVLAALSLKSGDIVWRQILERGIDGRITYMHVDNEIITISGSRTPIVRGWELENGHALFEWTVGPIFAQNYAKFLAIDDSLVLLQFPHGELTAQWFNLRTGSALGSKRMAIDLEDASKCVIQGNNIVCLESDLIVVTIGNSGSIDVKSEKIGEGLGNLKPIPGKLSAVSVDSIEKRILVQITPEIKIIGVKTNPGVLLSSAVNEQQELIVSSNVVKNVRLILVFIVDF